MAERRVLDTSAWLALDEAEPGASPGYFTRTFTKFLAQRARSPAHRGHRADTVFDSVSSVWTSVRSVKKEFLEKSVIDAG